MDPDERVRRFLDDDRAIERLLAAIEAAPEVAEDEINRWVRSRGRRPSAAELRVLEALSRGMTHEQAAEMLGWPLETVRDLSKRGRYKLRAKNTAHACCEALRRGLIR